MPTLTQLVVALQANTAGLAAAGPALQQLTNQLNITQQAVANLAAQTQQGMANIITAVGVAAQAQVHATNQVTAALGTNTTAHGHAAAVHTQHNAALQELIKATQIYLGPLSGVASRIQALSTSIREVGPWVASLGLGFVALAYVTFKAIEEGAQFEQRFLRIQGVLDATNNAMGTTAQELSDIAEEIKRTTLASEDSARSAAAALATFPNIGIQIAKSALLAAQGLSLIGRGDIESQIRRLGKILEDPINNMNALSESGVKFNAIERLKIESLQRSGNLFGAQAAVLERTRAAQALATSEANGLVGAWDKLKKSWNELFQAVGASGGVIGVLEANLRDLGDVFDELGQHEEVIKVVSSFLKGEIAGIGNAARNTWREIETFIGWLKILNKWMEDHGHWVLAAKKEYKDLPQGIDSVTSALDAEAAGWQKVADARRKVLQDQKTKIDPGLTLGQAEDNLTRFTQATIPLLTQVKKWSEEQEGLNKTLEKFDTSASEGRDKLEALRKELGLSESALKALQEAYKLGLDTAVGKAVQHMEEENQVAKENVRIHGALGGAKAKLMADQAALNAILAAGFRLTRDGTIIETERTIELGVSADRVANLAREQTALNIATSVAQRTVSTQLALEVSQRELVLATTRATTIARAGEIAGLQTLNSMLEFGATKEQAAAAAKNASAKAITDIKKAYQDQNAAIEDTIKLQGKEVGMFGQVEDLRNIAIKLAEREIELTKTLGKDNQDLIDKQMALYRTQLLQNRALDDMKSIANKIENSFYDMGIAINNAFLTGKLTADTFRQEAIKALLAIENEILKLLILKPLLNSMLGGAGGGLGSLFGLGGGGTSLGDGSAKGNIFDRGNVIPFSGGGIITRPTIFPMAKGMGLAGEAGPEAIMPLMRGRDGRLGVAGGGGDTRVEVNVINNHAGAAIEERRSNRGGVEVYDIVVSNMNRAIGSGDLDPALRNWSGRQRGAQR